MPEHRVQNWQVRKPLARSRGGIVATQNRIAGEAGARILAAGGNAVDAAVAIHFALAVVYPAAGNLGGGGFMLIHLARGKKTIAIDYREMAGALAERRMFLDGEGRFVNVDDDAALEPAAILARRRDDLHVFALGRAPSYHAYDLTAADIDPSDNFRF